jgi:D-alanyl-D-alanine dipeptidase
LTHLPLPYANVYLNHTTIGTATDENGKFELKNVPVDKYEFVFSYVGYNTIIQALTLKPDRHLQLVVKLLPTDKELKNVIITAKRDKAWQKNYERFKRELFGNTTNSRLCSILNPEVVNLIEGENGLLAETSEPLEIENHALGYKIFLTLKKFVIDDEGYSLEFKSRFDSLQPTSNSEQLRWEINRLNSYAGSEMHLFRSILDHRSWPEGFNIMKQNGNAILNIYGGNLVATSNFTVPFDDNSIAKDSTNNNLTVVFEKGKYLITYEKQLLTRNQQTIKGATYATSIVEVNSSPLKVDRRGIAILPSDCFMKGTMTTHRIAYKLPADYDPEKSRRKIASCQPPQSGFIEGIVIDSITGKPISGAVVFINFSMSHTKTNEAGKFRLQEIETGINDVVIAKSSYLVKHVNLLSDSTAHPANTFTLSRKPFHRLLHSEDTDREVEISKFKANLFSHQLIRNEKQVTIRVDEENNKYFDSYLPLEVIDKKLGYAIKVFLEKGKPSKKENDNIILPKAASYFENIDTLFENQHAELMRLDAYEGSLLNFSRALLYGRTIEEGFSIYKNSSSVSFNLKKNISEKEREEIFPANLLYGKSREGITTVELPDWIEVHHLLPTSTNTRVFKLLIPTKKIEFNAYGIISTGLNNIIIDARPSDKKLIPKLPIDYRPPKEFPLNSF